MDRPSVFDGEIIEEYLDDDPYPSCLISGQTFSGNPVLQSTAFGLIIRRTAGRF
ncbi:DUF4258 domain-containing protein [Candidatus Methanocrinis natronophilus]|uniref:DUF4258 domain-containing protein n=1 Tax=Candidatus Methanocrinis natronophilus TaxID=3033396 RepID=UPI0037443575